MSKTEADLHLQQHRYEMLADEITRLIESDVLRSGMRAPSLRSVANRHKVSMSTAQQAYRLLEDRGLLEARPKSGFYVTHFHEQLRPAPARTSPSSRPTPINIDGTSAEIFALASNPAFAPLGCAVPSSNLLAAGKLDRHLSRSARVRGLELNTYPTPHGDPSLREQISLRMMRIGQAAPPDEIITTNGCTEALTLALAVTTSPGDTVAIESPCYFGLLRALKARGLMALELPTHPVKGVEPEALEKALQTRKISACLLSSSFNNPLGCTSPDSAKLEIISLLTKHGVPLIEDDIYGEIYFGPERPSTFAALAPEADILSCSSFSKTIAPGYRIGWVAAGSRSKQILEAKFATSLASPTLTQAAIAEFLGSGGYDSHLRRIRQVFASNIERMTRTIERSFPESTRISVPQGGFVLWLELPDDFNATELYRRAVKERICFVPGYLFSATGQYGNCLRLSCGHDWDYRIERSVERLGELAHEMIGARPE